MRRFALIILIMALGTVLCAGTFAAADPLQEGIDAYRAGQYQTALKSLQTALTGSARLLSNAEQVICHRYLGMTYIAFDNVEEALDQFIQALEKDPATDFDADLTSPKILAVFSEAKTIFFSRHPELDPKNKKTAPVFPIQKPRHKNKPDPKWISGWALVGTAGACLATSGVTYGLMWDRAAKYNDENDDKDRADTLKNQAGAFGTVSAVTLGIGAVAAGIGTYLLLTSDTYLAAVHRENFSIVVVPAPGNTVAVALKF